MYWWRVSSSTLKWTKKDQCPNRKDVTWSTRLHIVMLSYCKAGLARQFQVTVLSEIKIMYLKTSIY